MAPKLVTAFKENKNDIRKKIVVVGGIVVVTVVTGVVLHKLNSQRVDVFVISENGADAVEAAVEATTE